MFLINVEFLYRLCQLFVMGLVDLCVGMVVYLVLLWILQCGFFYLTNWVHRWGNLFIMRNCMEVSDWTLRLCVPLLWARMNPSFPIRSRPKSLTVLELTTRISFSVASQCSHCRFIWIAHVMGISKLLKHLYFVKESLGCLHLEVLQLWSILSASSLLTKLLGLPLSASQSISV